MISRQRATTSAAPKPASEAKRQNQRAQRSVKTSEAHNQRSVTTSAASQPAQRHNQRSDKTSFWHTFC